MYIYIPVHVCCDTIYLLTAFCVFHPFTIRIFHPRTKWWKDVPLHDFRIKMVVFNTHWNIDNYSFMLYVYGYYIVLEPVCPLFWWLNPPKQGLFQSKQGSFGFQGYMLYINGYYSYMFYIREEWNWPTVIRSPFFFPLLPFGHPSVGSLSFEVVRKLLRVVLSLERRVTF